MEPSHLHNILEDNNVLQIIGHQYADAMAEYRMPVQADELNFDTEDEDVEILEVFSDTSSENMDESDRESIPEDDNEVMAERPEPLHVSDSRGSFYCEFFDEPENNDALEQARNYSDESDCGSDIVGAYLDNAYGDSDNRPAHYRFFHNADEEDELELLR